MLHSVCLYTNKRKDRGLTTSRMIVESVREMGMEIKAAPDIAAELGLPAFNSETDNADLAIVLGGDGTVLKAAHMFSPLGIPLLGVNYGTLGFLAEIDREEIRRSLELIHTGQFHIENRSMLNVIEESENRPVIALNEIGLFRKQEHGVVRLAVYCNDSIIGVYACNGIMVSTPTGSTGYSLSAGGPIVDPGVDCLVITPVCAHSFSARPVVVPGEAKVSIQVVNTPSGCSLMADDIVYRLLSDGEKITIGKAAPLCRFVRLGPPDFYGQLGAKLMEWNNISAEGSIT
ncbi:MAG: NAD(+)/NADH kinase [Clostridia bacterium]|nr:NAD(+)/NADH kinase [Clostridia bacterium]